MCGGGGDDQPRGDHSVHLSKALPSVYQGVQGLDMNRGEW